MSNDERHFDIQIEFEHRSPGNGRQRGFTAANLIRPHGPVARANKTRGGFGRRRRRRYGL